MKRTVLDNLKNMPGWHTAKKLVVFAVDDYGNVRLDSRLARDRMLQSGVPLEGRFDHFDALETRQDLEALLNTLASVTDCHGRNAVFTPYALSANPDFEKMSLSNHAYHYEPLTRTFDRLASDHPGAYDGAWLLWQEGIRLGLLKPQFHGREHLNVELLEQKLKIGDRSLRLNIANRSMAGLRMHCSLPGVGFTHGFGLWERSEVDRHKEIIADGLKLFKQVYGLDSISFTPPGAETTSRSLPFCRDAGRAFHRQATVLPEATRSSQYDSRSQFFGAPSPSRAYICGSKCGV